MPRTIRHRYHHGHRQGLLRLAVLCQQLEPAGRARKFNSHVPHLISVWREEETYFPVYESVILMLLYLCWLTLRYFYLFARPIKQLSLGCCSPPANSTTAPGSTPCRRLTLRDASKPLLTWVSFTYGSDVS